MMMSHFCDKRVNVDSLSNIRDQMLSWTIKWRRCQSNYLFRILIAWTRKLLY